MDPMPVTTLEYVLAPVTAPDGVNLNSLPVEVSLVVHDGPYVEAEWHDGEWRLFDGALHAALLVGPGSAAGTFTPGPYDLRVRVTDDPEIPVMFAGVVNFTL